MTSMMDILSGATPLIVDVRQSGSGPYFLPGALGSANLPPLSPSFDPVELLPQFTSGGGW
jgi:hypothetical protein